MSVISVSYAPKVIFYRPNVVEVNGWCSLHEHLSTLRFITCYGLAGCAQSALSHRMIDPFSFTERVENGPNVLNVFPFVWKEDSSTFNCIHKAISGTRFNKSEGKMLPHIQRTKHTASGIFSKCHKRLPSPLLLTKRRATAAEYCSHSCFLQTGSARFRPSEKLSQLDGRGETNFSLPAHREREHDQSQRGLSRRRVMIGWKQLSVEVGTGERRGETAGAGLSKCEPIRRERVVASSSIGLWLALSSYYEQFW